MKEDQDGLFRRVFVRGRSPYVQGEAVFALRRTKTTGKGVDNVLGLRGEAREVDRSRSSLWTVADDKRSIYEADDIGD
jgi:hypothetical protein